MFIALPLVIGSTFHLAHPAFNSELRNLIAKGDESLTDLKASMSKGGWKCVGRPSTLKPIEAMVIMMGGLNELNNSERVTISYNWIAVAKADIPSGAKRIITSRFRPKKNIFSPRIRVVSGVPLEFSFDAAPQRCYTNGGIEVVTSIMTSRTETKKVVSLQLRAQFHSKTTPAKLLSTVYLPKFGEAVFKREDK